MNKKIIFQILAGLVILAVIAAVGVFAFQAGMSRGAGLNLPVGGDELRQFGRGFGHGFGGMPFMGHIGGFFFLPFLFLKCLIPLILLFLVFGIIRRMMWGRHMMHGHGPWGQHGEREGVPPMFDEWHRRAHAKPDEKPAEPPAEPPAV